MNNDMQINDDELDLELQDIEQMLAPRVQFHAPDSLKDEVMEKARLASKPLRTVRLWPWFVAACMVGAIALLLVPPKTEDNTESKPLVAKTEGKSAQQPVKEVLPIATEESEAETSKTQKRAKAHHPGPVSKPGTPTMEHEPEETPVQMSEETRMELLMTQLSTSTQEMQREVDLEEETRQLRIRGERMLSQVNI